MSDVICRKCGEPWEAYGIEHGDMTKPEAKRFLNGEGCPSCHFGTRCTQCDGTGKKGGDWYCHCDTCRDRGYIFAWTVNRTFEGYHPEKLYFGYSPNVRVLSDDAWERTTLGQMKMPEEVSRNERQGCWEIVYRVPCPEGCAESLPPCTFCNGTGALTRNEEEAAKLDQKANASIFNALDEIKLPWEPM